MVTLFNIPVKRMLVVVLVVLMGCKDSDKNSSLIFEELNESLERSNKAIDNSTSYMLLSLKDKSHEAAPAEKAVFWLLKADSIHTNAKELIGFINKLKSYSKEKKIEIGQRNSNDLYKRLKVFNEFILNSDPYINREFKEVILALSKNNSNEFEFNQVNFTDKDELKTKMALLKFENDVRNIENMVVVFCKNQVGYLDGPGFFRKFQVITAVNSTKLGVGEELILNVGVGEFDNTSKPDYLINGVKVLPNEKGVGEYKIKVGNKIGKQKINIKISYTASDGIRDSLNKNIEYTVVE